MRLKPLIFFALAALLPFLGTVYAQQRPPQTIDDLFNPRPTAPAPQQRERPDAVQQEPLPPPPAAKETKESKSAKSKKKKDEQKREAQDQQDGIRDIMAPPKSGPKSKNAKQEAPELPADQPQQDVKIPNPTAVFSGLDKITGRIYPFEVSVKETVQFGALRVTPEACYTRPPTEPQNTTGFVEVDEITLEGKIRRIFTGWMFASSPGLHAVEHPIYDVWLVDCKQGAPDTAKSG